VSLARQIVRELIPGPLVSLKRRLFRIYDGDVALRSRFQCVHNRPFDPANIDTFTEKLFNRMIDLNRNSDERFTYLADKLAVRDYVRNAVGAQYLTDLIWSGDDPNKIPFDELPNECIIKTNHGCGDHIVCRSTLDRESAIGQLSATLAENYFWRAQEYQYYNIKPCVMVEEFLDDGFEEGPLDFRFWCFNGTTEVIQVDNHAHSINPFYDTAWQKLSLHYRDDNRGEIAKPINFAEMLNVAARLSQGMDFVRVDLYNIRGRIVFGELTFAPTAGNLRLKPSCWDKRLGAKWII
jgi:hypothetical protein